MASERCTPGSAGLAGKAVYHSRSIWHSRGPSCGHSNMKESRFPLLALSADHFMTWSPSTKPHLLKLAIQVEPLTRAQDLSAWWKHARFRCHCLLFSWLIKNSLTQRELTSYLYLNFYNLWYSKHETFTGNICTSFICKLKFSTIDLVRLNSLIMLCWFSRIDICSISQKMFRLLSGVVWMRMPQ